MESKNLVLRTMYIDPDVDDQLRREAFDKRTSKNDLLRQYLRLGMETARQADMTDSPFADMTVPARGPVPPFPLASSTASAAGSPGGTGNVSAAGAAGGTAQAGAAPSGSRQVDSAGAGGVSGLQVSGTSARLP